MSEPITAALLALIDERIDAALARRKQPANDEYLSTADAARIARVTTGTIRRWVRDHHLTRHGSSGRVLVRRDELERHLAGEPEQTPEDRAARRFGGG